MPFGPHTTCLRSYYLCEEWITQNGSTRCRISIEWSVHNPKIIRMVNGTCTDKMHTYHKLSDLCYPACTDIAQQANTYPFCSTTRRSVAPNTEGAVSSTGVHTPKGPEKQCAPLFHRPANGLVPPKKIRRQEASHGIGMYQYCGLGCQVTPEGR